MRLCMQAIAHLIHRDYEAIVQDFVTLDFIPRGEETGAECDLTPVSQDSQSVGSKRG